MIQRLQKIGFFSTVQGFIYKMRTRWKLISVIHVKIFYTKVINIETEYYSTYFVFQRPTVCGIGWLDDSPVYCRLALLLDVNGTFLFNLNKDADVMSIFLSWILYLYCISDGIFFTYFHISWIFHTYYRKKLRYFKVSMLFR